MWIDDLSAATDGATIDIPRGIYTVNPIVIDGKSIVLRGAGRETTKITLRSCGHLLSITGGSVSIMGLDLDGNKAAFVQSPYAVVECDACNLTMVDTIIRNGKEFGLDCRGCQSVNLDNVITANCGDKGSIGAGMYFRDGCGDVTISNCADYGSGLTGGAEGAAVQTADCDSLMVDGYYSQDAAKYAIKLQASGAKLSRVYVVRNGGLAAISLQGNRYTLDNIFIRDGVGSGIDINRFETNSSNREIAIRNTSIERQSWNGVYVLNQLDAENPMDGITLENVTINRCQYGIRFRGNISASVNGASLMDNQRGFWSQGDSVGSPSGCALYSVDAFGIDIQPINGFTVIEGDGILNKCRAWNNLINYNGDAYTKSDTNNLIFETLP